MTALITRYRLLGLTLVTEGAALALALILSLLFKVSIWPLTEYPLRDIILGTIWTALPLGLFFFLLSEKAEKIPLLASLKKIMLTDVRRIFQDTRLIDLVLISILAGFCEELLFRGVIQAKFGLIAASVIFGLLHFVTPAYAVIATILGLYIGGLSLFYNSLLLPIQVHILYDFGALLYLRFFIKERVL